jgi:hypothetical protein
MTKYPGKDWFIIHGDVLNRGFKLATQEELDMAREAAVQGRPRTMYRIKPYGDDIEEIQVLKATAHFMVWRVKPTHRDKVPPSYRREKIRGSLYLTWDEAHGALIERLKEQLRYREEQYRKACSDLLKARKLTKPAA